MKNLCPGELDEKEIEIEVQAGGSGLPMFEIPGMPGAQMGAINIGDIFGKLGGKLSLDLQLSAMQTTGNGRILSNPKILTSNNKEAKISSGTDIPIRIVSATATTSGGSNGSKLSIRLPGETPLIQAKMPSASSPPARAPGQASPPFHNWAISSGLAR